MSLDPHALDELLEGFADLVAERLAARLADGPPAHTREAAANGWRLLSVEEVAEVLGRSPRWVHDAVATRGLPTVHLDARGGRMFELEAVQAWARRRRVPAEGP